MAKIKGNKKNNKLKGKGQNDKILGLAGDDQLKGKVGDDKLNGGDGDDFLDGGTGNDVMKGGAGNDFFEAGEGGDFFVGGTGIDTVSFAQQAFGISVELLTMTTTFDGLQDGFSGIENIDGTQSGDTIEGDGAANHFRGFAGNDYLKGGDGNDILDGGEGDDQVYSDNGGDQLIGGNGFDSLVYEKATSGAVINLATGVGGGSAAGDTFSGFERVFGTQFGDSITGTDGEAEALFGEGGNDNLYGNGKDDTLFGDTGLDNLYGGEGNDRLSPEGDVAEADHLYGGNGSDWADYSDAAAAVTVNLINGTGSQQALGDTYDSIENVQGSDYNDTLIAGLNGRAYGGWGDDIIFDAAGTEILRGERGADQLTDSFLGSEDGLHDYFVLEVNLGMDIIGGFSQSTSNAGDRFWLQEGQFNLSHNSNGTLTPGQIFNTNNSTATNSTQRLIFDKDAGDKILYYDADGNGTNAAPIAIAKIGNLAEIAETDFLVLPNL